MSTEKIDYHSANLYYPVTYRKLKQGPTFVQNPTYSDKAKLNRDKIEEVSLHTPQQHGQLVINTENRFALLPELTDTTNTPGTSYNTTPIRKTLNKSTTKKDTIPPSTFKTNKYINTSSHNKPNYRISPTVTKEEINPQRAAYLQSLLDAKLEEIRNKILNLPVSLKTPKKVQEILDSYLNDDNIFSDIDEIASTFTGVKQKQTKTWQPPNKQNCHSKTKPN